MIDGSALGAGLTTYATLLLLANIINKEIFIDPLIGLTTFIAGIGFVTMGAFKNMVDKK